MVDLTYSEIIYLFADKYVSKRSKLVNFDTHPTGEKITAEPLARKVVLAALVYLHENKFISLSIKEEKKLFIFSGKELYINKTGEQKNLSGIEKKLIENIDGETKVWRAVYYLLGDDEVSPWGHFVNIAKQSLVEKGILSVTKEKKIFSFPKYSFNKDREQFKKEYEQAVNAVKKFSQNNELNSLATKAIDKGIGLRREYQSSDD
jgi:hypothetical protein